MPERSEENGLLARLCYHKLLLSRAVWASRVLAVVSLIQLIRAVKGLDFLGAVIALVASSLAAAAVLDLRKRLASFGPVRRLSGVASALEHLHRAREKASSVKEEAKELLFLVAAIVFTLSVHTLVSEASVSGSLGGSDRPRSLGGSDRHRPITQQGDCALATRAECQSSFAWSAGALLGLVWLPLRLPLTGAVGVETFRGLVMLVVRTSYALAEGNALAVVLAAGEQAALWALNVLLLTVHTEPVPAVISGGEPYIGESFRQLPFYGAVKAIADEFASSRSLLMGDETVLDGDVTFITAVGALCGGLAFDLTPLQAYKCAFGAVIVSTILMGVTHGQTLPRKLTAILRRLHEVPGQAASRKLKEGLQTCSDEQALIDTALANIRACDPSVVAAALSTFVPADGSALAAAKPPQRGQGQGRQAVRQVHKIARPLQSAAAAGEPSELAELLAMRRGHAARKSFDSLLSDGAPLDWCADSDDLAGGVDSFSDWAVAASDELRAREAARAAQAVRGVSWQVHLRALTFSLTVGPNILGYVMVLTEDHARVPEEMEGLQRFREAVAGAVAGIRVQKKAAAKEVAQKKVAMQRRFLNHVSHELRTPLNAVMGLTALALEDGDLTATTHDYLTTALASCTGLLGIISQMIEFSEYDAALASGEGGAAISFDERPFEVGALAEEVLDILGAKAVKAGTELILDIQPEARQVVFVGDNVRLRQCVAELADNSLKYAPPGKEVCIQIGCAAAAAGAKRGSWTGGGGDAADQGPQAVTARRASAGTAAGLADHAAAAAAAGADGGGASVVWLEVSVADTGFIPPEQQEKLFSPFAQGTKPGGVKPAGLGLGLCTVRHILTHMCGQISCVSIRGTGTRFRFSVPLRVTLPGPERPRAPLALRLPPAADVAVSVARPTLSAALGRWLATWGCRRVFELPPERALLLDVSIVVVEFHLLNRVLLLKGSEALPALPKTRLVVLGKPADRASLQKAWPAYAQSFVTKPVKPSVLIERILTQLARLDAAPADAEAAAAAARAGAEEAPEAPWCIPVGDASTAAVAVGAPTVLRQTDGEVAGKARPRKSPPLRLVTEVRAEAPLAAAAVQVDRTPRLSKGSIGTESPVPPQEHWGGQPVAGRRVSDVLRRRSAELTRPAAPASRLSGGLAGGRPARLQSMTGVPSPGAGAEPPSGPTPGSGGVRLGGFREFALGSEEAIAGLLTERGGSCHSGGPPGAAGGDGPGAGSTPRAGAAKGSSGGELRRGDSTRSDDEPWPGGDLLGGAAEQDNTPAGRALLAEQARAALTALRPVRRRESIETSEKAAERWRAEKKEAARAGGAMHRGSSAGFLSVKSAGPDRNPWRTAAGPGAGDAAENETPRLGSAGLPTAAWACIPWQVPRDQSDTSAASDRRRFSMNGDLAEASDAGTAEAEAQGGAAAADAGGGSGPGGAAGGAAGAAAKRRERSSVGTPAAAAGAQPAGSQSAWSGGSSPAPRGIHALLVEDNKVNQKVATAVLSRCGCTVAVANDGLEALILVKEGHSYDIIFMDLDMPVMNGLESTRRIRDFEAMLETPEASRLYIVALTAHSSDEDKRDCREAGMQSFMSKPITPQLVRDELALWAERGRARPRGE